MLVGWLIGDGDFRDTVGGALRVRCSPPTPSLPGTLRRQRCSCGVGLCLLDQVVEAAPLAAGRWATASHVLLTRHSHAADGCMQGQLLLVGHTCRAEPARSLTDLFECTSTDAAAQSMPVCTGSRCCETGRLWLCDVGAQMRARCRAVIKECSGGSSTLYPDRIQVSALITPS